MSNKSLIFFTLFSMTAHAVLIGFWPAKEQALLRPQESSIEIGMVSLPLVNIDFTQDRSRPNNPNKVNKKQSATQDPATDATVDPAKNGNQRNRIKTLSPVAKVTSNNPTEAIDEENSTHFVAATSSSQPDISPVSASKAAPLYSRNSAPDYPSNALRYGWEGEVWLKVAIGSSGAVDGIIIEQSSDYLILDQAAVKAVYDWQFEPARVGEEPTESSIRIPIRFKIKRS